MTTATRKRVLNALLTIAMVGATAPLRAQAIVVTTTAELQAALTPANAGKRILVRAGEYEIGQALTVPDDATLVGEGDMIFDESGLPTGFAPGGRTVIRSTPTLVGDVLTQLGDELLRRQVGRRHCALERDRDADGVDVVGILEAPGGQCVAVGDGVHEPVRSTRASSHD